MKGSIVVTTGLVLGLAFGWGGCEVETDSETTVISVGGEGAKDSVESPIEAKADKALRKMSDALAGMKTFSVELEGAMDERRSTGQYVEIMRWGKMVVERPNRMYVEIEGGGVERSIWYDDAVLTILDGPTRSYAQEEVLGGIDDLLEFLAEKYGMTIPGLDFLLPEAYEGMMKNVQRGTYVGLHKVDERECHHLLFEQEEIDWQVWIDAGRLAAPRKLAMVWKLEPGAPQYTLFLKWRSLRKAPAEQFEFQPPKGTEEKMPDDLRADDVRAGRVGSVRAAGGKAGDRERGERRPGLGKAVGRPVNYGSIRAAKAAQAGKAQAAYPAIGSYLGSLPGECTEVAVNSETCYLCEGVYYSKDEEKGGYVVVAGPQAGGERMFVIKKDQRQPDPGSLLSNIGAYMRVLENFNIRSTHTVDEVLDSGAKVQLSSLHMLYVSRPNRLRVDIEGDGESRGIWYSDKEVTMFDRKRNQCGSITAGETIAETVTELGEKYGLAIPLSDLLSAYAYAEAAGRILTSEYIEASEVLGYKCHHLAFTGVEVDWQIWVSAEVAPLPRKMVITYKDRPGTPRYTVLVHSWDQLFDISASFFEFKAPAGAERIEIVPVVPE